ncbi:unnamed protein product, partial [Prorocentrum cordatum]
GTHFDPPAPSALGGAVAWLRTTWQGGGGDGGGGGGGGGGRRRREEEARAGRAKTQARALAPSSEAAAACTRLLRGSGGGVQRRRAGGGTRMEGGLGLEVWGRRLRLPRQGPAGPGSLAAAAAGEAAPGGAAAPRHPRVLGRGVVLPVGGGGTPRRGRRTSSTPWVTMKRRRPRIVLHFSTSFQSSALRTKRLLLQSLPSNTQ